MFCSIVPTEGKKEERSYEQREIQRDVVERMKEIGDLIPQQWVSPCGNHCTHKYAALTQIPCKPLTPQSMF